MKVLESTHILTRLVEAKRERLHKAKMRVPEVIVKRMAATAPETPSFRRALESGDGTTKVSLIVINVSEIERSPSHTHTIIGLLE